METDVRELRSLLKKFKLTDKICDKPVSDYHLKKISRTCCSRWRSLRTHLELGSLVVNDIDNCYQGEEDKRSIFFSVWKCRKGLLATYKKLIHALLKIECRDDAEKVCELLVSVQQRNSSASESSQPTLLKRMPAPDSGCSFDASSEDREIPVRLDDPVLLEVQANKIWKGTRVKEILREFFNLIMLSGFVCCLVYFTSWTAEWLLTLRVAEGIVVGLLGITVIIVAIAMGWRIYQEEVITFTSKQLLVATLQLCSQQK